jgi:hypothetical protein
MMDPTPEEKLAVEQFLLNVTLPVLYDWGDKGIDQIATGTLFCVRDRYFWITSRHLFDGTADITYDPAKISFPVTPRGPTVYTLGKSTLIQPSLASIDVAILEILEHEAIDRLGAGWRFLSPGNVEIPSYEGRFILCGYPSVALRKRGELLGGTLAAIYTDRMRVVPEDALPSADPRIDMFFHLDGDATSFDGKPVEVPKLQGMSGASIWRLLPAKMGQLWTAESRLRVMGVQSRYRPQRFFRAINWLGVIEMFRMLDEGLAASIEDGIHR